MPTSDALTRRKNRGALLFACGLLVPACQGGKGATGGTDTAGTGSTSATEPSSESDSDSGPNTDPGEGPACGDAGALCIAPIRNVDVLFVIDNSGSMAEEQARLAANFSSFIEVLEDPRVNADYRIAITTTDAGNPRCPLADTTPENGNFVASSCLGRVALGDFLFEGVDPPEDAAYACTDNCSLGDSELALRPTTIDGDDSELARPWIERIAGQTNLPEGVSTTEAFKCFAPQGITGCGFESPLESLYKGFIRAETVGEDNYGFLRDDALLAIVILTDELDCSYNDAFKDIFQTNKVFWNSPDDLYPTSSMCWRAGVTCEGEGPDYGDCWEDDYNTLGDPVADPDSAVLHPLSRYVDLIQMIEQDKMTINANAEVHVSVIAGVPQGYPDEPLVYGGGAQEFLDLYGVGPGCTAGDGGTAVPPVRLRSFAEAFQIDDAPNLFSICDDDYSQALASIAERLRSEIKPPCIPECVADTNPNTPVLEPSCTFYNTDADDNVTTVPKCVQEGEEWAPPQPATLCYLEFVDSNAATPTPSDDLSQACVDAGWNLEIQTIALPGVKPRLTFECKLSESPMVDCPGLF